MIEAKPNKNHIACDLIIRDAFFPDHKTGVLVEVGAGERGFRLGKRFHDRAAHSAWLPIVEIATSNKLDTARERARPRTKHLGRLDGRAAAYPRANF